MGPASGNVYIPSLKFVADDATIAFTFPQDYEIDGLEGLPAGLWKGNYDAIFENPRTPASCFYGVEVYDVQWTDNMATHKNPGVHLANEYVVNRNMISSCGKYVLFPQDTPLDDKFYALSKPEKNWMEYKIRLYLAGGGYSLHHLRTKKAIEQFKKGKLYISGIMSDSESDHDAARKSNRLKQKSRIPAIMSATRKNGQSEQRRLEEAQRVSKKRKVVDEDGNDGNFSEDSCSSSSDESEPLESEPDEEETNETKLDPSASQSAADAPSGEECDDVTLVSAFQQHQATPTDVPPPVPPRRVPPPTSSKEVPPPATARITPRNSSKENHQQQTPQGNRRPTYDAARTANSGVFKTPQGTGVPRKSLGVTTIHNISPSPGNVVDGRQSSTTNQQGQQVSLLVDGAHRAAANAKKPHHQPGNAAAEKSSTAQTAADARIAARRKIQTSPAGQPSSTPSSSRPNKSSTVNTAAGGLLTSPKTGESCQRNQDISDPTAMPDSGGDDEDAFEDILNRYGASDYDFGNEHHSAIIIGESFMNGRHEASTFNGGTDEYAQESPRRTFINLGAVDDRRSNDSLQGSLPPSMQNTRFNLSQGEKFLMERNVSADTMALNTVMWGYFMKIKDEIIMELRKQASPSTQPLERFDVLQESLVRINNKLDLVVPDNVPSNVDPPAQLANLIPARKKKVLYHIDVMLEGSEKLRKETVDYVWSKVKHVFQGLGRKKHAPLSLALMALICRYDLPCHLTGERFDASIGVDEKIVLDGPHRLMHTALEGIRKVLYEVVKKAEKEKWVHSSLADASSVNVSIGTWMRNTRRGILMAALKLPSNTIPKNNATVDFADAEKIQDWADNELRTKPLGSDEYFISSKGLV